MLRSDLKVASDYKNIPRESMIYFMIPTLLYGFFKESTVVKGGLLVLISYLDLRFTSSAP